MADVIKKPDISEKDPAGNLTSSLEKAEKQAIRTEKAIQKLLIADQKLISQRKSPTNIKEVKALNTVIKSSEKNVKDLNTARKKTIAIDKELQQARKIEIAQVKQQVKETKAIEQALIKFQKEQKKTRKATVDNANEFKRLTKRTNNAQDRFKRLAAQYGISSKQAIAAGKSFRRLDDRLRAINNSARDGRRDVGRYGLALQKVRGALSTGLGAIGITAGIAGLGRVVGNTIGIFSGFQKSNSKLQAVLNATKEDMDDLKAESKAFGATTSFTASEVVDLQTELAKLGFPTQDIIDMTGSTLAAAEAMGSGLGAQAALTGSTLKAFGLAASEAGRVNDVLAKATTSSALDFEKLNASMSTIAPVAASFGFSLEGTVALLGNLSDAGFDASSAATATRNILLNLADANSKLGKSLKEPVTDLPSLVKGLKQLKSEGIDLGEALELTDKRSVAAFSTFLEGTDSVLELNEALEEAGGTAQKMADIQLDNLAGSVTILNSAWEGFILSLEDGEGKFSNILRTIVDVTTELLSMATGTAKAADELDEAGQRIRNIANNIVILAKVLGSVIAGFVAYRIVLRSISIATKIYTAVTNALKVAQVALKGGLKGATKAMKGLNLATKANIFAAIATLVLAAVAAFFIFRDAANEAADAQRNLNQARLDALEAQKSIEARIKILTKLNKAALITLLADIEATKEKVKADERLTQQLLKREEQEESLARLRKGAIDDDKDAQLALRAGLITETQLLNLRGDISSAIAVGIIQTKDLVKAQEEEIKQSEVNIRQTQKELDLLEEERIIVQARLDFLNREGDLNKKGAKDAKDLIQLKQEEIKARREIVATTTAELAIKNEELRNLGLQLKILQELGIEKDKSIDRNKKEAESLAVLQAIRQAELDGLIAVNERLLNNDNLTAEERVVILEKLFELRKSAIEEAAAFELENEKLTAEERELIAVELHNSLADLEGERVDAVKNANALILESEKELQSQREALADARISTAKNVADILSNIAGEDEKRQKQIQDLQKALAVSEILINLRREVSGIREGNAGKEGSTALNAAQILQARTAALAGVASVLSAYDGVDDTGSGGNLDSKGGFWMKGHPHEQMLSHANRKEVADPKTGKLRTRRELMDKVHIADNLAMSPHAFKQMEVGQIVQPKDVDFKILTEGLSKQTKELKQAFEAGQTTYKVNWNSHGEAVVNEMKGNISKRTTHKRSRL